jgi:hypothetical protein
MLHQEKSGNPGVEDIYGVLSAFLAPLFSAEFVRTEIVGATRPENFPFLAGKRNLIY